MTALSSEYYFFVPQNGVGLFSKKIREVEKKENKRNTLLLCCFQLTRNTDTEWRQKRIPLKWNTYMYKRLSRRNNTMSTVDLGHKVWYATQQISWTELMREERCRWGEAVLYGSNVEQICSALTNTLAGSEQWQEIYYTYVRTAVVTKHLFVAMTTV